MRTAKFSVPIDVIVDFVQRLCELELNNTITAITVDDEIEIEILYEMTETPEVDELEEYLEELIDSIEKMEEEEDN